MKKLYTILAALTLVALCIFLLPTEARAASESCSNETASGSLMDGDQAANERNTRREYRAASLVNADDLVFLQSPSLSFQDYIGMQLLMMKSVAANYDKVYVEAVQVTPEGEVTTILNPITYLTNYYVFDQQIMAWSMTEVVTLTLYAEKDGVTYVGETYTQSVESLALAMLEKYSANTTICQMLVDMLNYGAAVQTQFSHNAENLPNTQLGDFAAMGSSNIPECDATNSKTGTATVKVLNDSVSMQAKVEIQLVIKGAVTATPKATIGTTVLNPVLDTTSIKGYTVIRVAVGATQLRETVTIALYDENDAPVTQVYNVSVEGYAVTAITGSQKDVVIAMMRYGNAVAEFAKPTAAQLASKIIATAKKYLGVPYVYGGSTPDGFDCSGYMMYCFAEHGVQLPRTSKDQSKFGTEISQSQLKRGDLIFFDTNNDGKVNHVGLYIGNGEFIHASTKRGMEIAELYDGYWNEHYLWARRVL